MSLVCVVVYLSLKGLVLGDLLDPFLEHLNSLLALLLYHVLIHNAFSWKERALLVLEKRIVVVFALIVTLLTLQL